MHCQNADWAISFLLHKFNMSARDSLVGTDFGKYVKYKRAEKRGGKPFLSGKSWKTTYVYFSCDFSSSVLQLSHKRCFWKRGSHSSLKFCVAIPFLASHEQR